MRSNKNTEHIEGYLYECQLTERVTGEKAKNPNTPYISGDITIAVDEKGLNVIPVHFRYVAPTFPSGKTNRNYEILKRLVEEKDSRTWVAAGKDNAFKLKINNIALEVNDFVPRDSQDNEVVSTQRNGGGFVDIVEQLAEEGSRATFEVDAFIHKVRRIEADEDKGIENDYLILECMCFDYKNAIFPATFNVHNENGIRFFEDADISGKDPLYTKIWGNISTTTIVKRTEEETAFGEAIIKESRRGIKEWIVTGTAKVPYDFGEEGIMTTDELTKLLQDREVVKAGVKADAIQRKEAAKTPASFGAAPTGAIPTQTPSIPTGNFKF